MRYLTLNLCYVVGCPIFVVWCGIRSPILALWSSIRCHLLALWSGVGRRIMRNGIYTNCSIRWDYFVQSQLDDESVLTLMLRRVQKMKFGIWGDFALCYIKCVMRNYSFYVIRIMMKWFWGNGFFEIYKHLPMRFECVNCEALIQEEVLLKRNSLR